MGVSLQTYGRLQVPVAIASTAANVCHRGASFLSVILAERRGFLSNRFSQVPSVCTFCYILSKRRTNARRFASKREFCHWCEGDDEVGGGFGGLDLAAAFRFRNMQT
ncbi:hypothetical protein R1flu_000829 [Riccia fluitans]|uniref:Uncharacterized protein n=1 Tax=Riccia fluitans TaxID=41844 RepID=A0ABD1Y1I9_9MARC